MRVRLAAVWIAGVTLACLSAPATGRTSGQDQVSRAATRMERKLRHLDANAAAAHPDPSPTRFTEKEINAYLASGRLPLPAGVNSVRLEGTPGMVTGSARVDFDQLRADQPSPSPLLAMFSGVHDVVVVAQTHGAGGKGFVHVDSVSLDGVAIPRFVLQVFVDTVVQPKHPEVRLDSQFDLPDRINTATVGLHELTVTQR
jgi:hypothetical protein